MKGVGYSFQGGTFELTFMLNHAERKIEMFIDGHKQLKQGLNYLKSVKTRSEAAAENFTKGKKAAPAVSPERPER